MAGYPHRLSVSALLLLITFNHFMHFFSKCLRLKCLVWREAVGSGGPAATCTSLNTFWSVMLRQMPKLSSGCHAIFQAGVEPLVGGIPTTKTCVFKVAVYSTPGAFPRHEINIFAKSPRLLGPQTGGFSKDANLMCLLFACVHGWALILHYRWHPKRSDVEMSFAASVLWTHVDSGWMNFSLSTVHLWLNRMLSDSV